MGLTTETSACSDAHRSGRSSEPGTGIAASDALHIAAALTAQCQIFVTSVRRLPAITGLHVLQLDELRQPPRGEYPARLGPVELSFSNHVAESTPPVFRESELLKDALMID